MLTLQNVKFINKLKTFLCYVRQQNEAENFHNMQTFPLTWKIWKMEFSQLRKSVRDVLVHSTSAWDQHEEEKPRQLKLESKSHKNDDVLLYEHEIKLMRFLSRRKKCLMNMKRIIMNYTENKILLDSLISATSFT